MKRMTWHEFKAHIDSQLKEKGIPQDEEIWYIDFSFPEPPGEQKSDYKVPDVYLNKDGLGIAIH